MTDLVKCSVHKDKEAEAICMKHYDFQCVSCVIEHAKSKECDIVDLNKPQEEREQCVIKFAVSKQRTTYLQDLNAAKISKLNNLKDKLLKQANDHYQKVASRLKDMVKSIEESIENQAGIIQKKILNENESLDRYKDDIETNLKTLSKEESDLKGRLENLDDINAQIDKLAKTPETEINGSFKPNTSFSDSLTVLGQASITSQNLYEDIDVRGKTTGQQGQDVTENTEQKALNYAPVPNVEDAESLNDQRSWLCNLFKKRSSSNKYEDVKTDETEVSKRQYDTIIIEEQPQQQQQQQREQQQQLLQLMDIGNKRIKIPNLKIDSSITASKCEQLVHVGGNYIGILSTSLSAVFITALPHGPSVRKKIPGLLSGITSVGPKAIAILIAKEYPQINVFTLEGNKLNASGSNILTETMTDISGFNFNVRSSTYVISCPTRCVFLGKHCKVIKTFSIPQTNCEDPGSIRSVYDFESEQIFYLNLIEKTLTAFSCKKESSELAWDKIISDEDFAPRSMCLCNDFICVASKSSISIFLREDGNHVKDIETSSILSDCLAVCGADGLLVWTSDSDEPELSESIGMVKI